MDAEVREHLRVRLFLRQQGMAGVALGRDDPPVERLVVAVVAAEAAEEVLVSDVVRVRTPGDLHVGPHVSPVHPLYLANRGLDGRAPGLVPVSYTHLTLPT